MKRLVLALALLALAPAPALAQVQPRMVMQFGTAGDPEISVGPVFSRSAVGDYRRCPPAGGACEPVTLPPPGFPGHPMGETAAGTVFEADIKDADGVVTTTVRSVPWQGRVTATSPPSLAGEAKVGATVTPVDGTWSGGWGDRPGWSNHIYRDVTYSWVIACRTPERTDCWRPLAGPLAQRWAGWYLFAVSSRHDGDMTGRPIPAMVNWPFPGRTTPVAGATYAYSAGALVCCTLAAPAEGKVTLRKQALRGGGKINVGRVTCADPCHVALRVSGGKKQPTITRFTAEGTRALKAPARRGKLRVRVYLDGELVRSASVRA